MSILFGYFHIFHAQIWGYFIAGKDRGSYNLSFLGIEIDSVRMVFRLLEDKLRTLLDLVDSFCAGWKVTLHQMQSLLGLLVFACRMMPMGRVFSHHLSVSHPEHRIRLTRPLRADLCKWREFLHSYNGSCGIHVLIFGKGSNWWFVGARQ